MKIFSKLEIFIIVKSEFSFTLVISQLIFIKSIILPIPKVWLVTHLADIHQKATINLSKGETCEFASSHCPIYKYDTVCKHSMRGTPWVRKFGYLCIRRILVTSRDCTSTWPPVYSTRTPTWNNSIIRYGKPNATQGFIWQEMAWLHGLLEKTTTKSSLFRVYIWCLLSSG